MSRQTSESRVYQVIVRLGQHKLASETFNKPEDARQLIEDARLKNLSVSLSRVKTITETVES